MSAGTFEGNPRLGQRPEVAFADQDPPGEGKLLQPLRNRPENPLPLRCHSKDVVKHGRRQVSDRSVAKHHHAPFLLKAVHAADGVIRDGTKLRQDQYLIRDAVLGRNRAFHRQYEPALCDAVRPAAQESAVKAVIRPDSPGTCGPNLPPTTRVLRNVEYAVAP